MFPHCPRTCSERKSAGDCPAFCNAANAPGVATSRPGGNSGRRSIAYLIEAPLEGFGFCFPGTAQAVQKKQMPFLAVAPRLAVRAVKGAPFAFTGAKRKPLTEEAYGLGAAFARKGREGKTKSRTMTEPNNRMRMELPSGGIAADVSRVSPS